VRDQTLSDLQRAAALDPANAARFERLGQRAEVEGDLALAESSLLRAAELSRLYQPRYLLAQYYFRRNDAPGWERWSSEAFTMAPGGVIPLVELAWQRKPNAEAMAEQALTERPFIARQFLFFLVRNGETRSAAKLARHLAETGGTDDRPVILGFCERALADANLTDAMDIWNILCRRKLLPYEPVSLVTNGDFRLPTVSNGFDWHIERTARQGRSVLHVDLTDAQASSVIAWQYAPLQRGARYRLRYEASGIADGIGVSVFYPEGGQWKEWLPGRAPEFESPSNLIRLVLMCRRPAGMGTVTGVRMEVQQ